MDYIAHKDMHVHTLLLHYMCHNQFMHLLSYQMVSQSSQSYQHLPSPWQVQLP